MLYIRNYRYSCEKTFHIPTRLNHSIVGYNASASETSPFVGNIAIFYGEELTQSQYCYWMVYLFELRRWEFALSMTRSVGRDYMLRQVANWMEVLDDGGDNNVECLESLARTKWVWVTAHLLQVLCFQSWRLVTRWVGRIWSQMSWRWHSKAWVMWMELYWLWFWICFGEGNLSLSFCLSRFSFSMGSFRWCNSSGKVEFWHVKHCTRVFESLWYARSCTGGDELSLCKPILLYCMTVVGWIPSWRQRLDASIAVVAHTPIIEAESTGSLQLNR